MIRALLLALALALAAPAYAQEDNKALTAPAFDDWAKVADRAENAVDEARASNAALEQLRVEIVEWRAQFQQARDQTEPRLNTLRQQLAALGPAPEAGKIEPEAVARRRAELNAQIAKQEAPRRAADEAYSRADSLIGQIDSMIRERQASEILQLGPSPLNPANWSQAIAAISGTFRAIVNESRLLWDNDAIAAQRRADLPVSALLLVFAMLCLVKGRGWARRLSRRFLGILTGGKRRVLDFIVSLIVAAIPVLGIATFVTAIISLKLFGYRGEQVVESLTALGFMVFGANWLGEQLFGRVQRSDPVLDLDDDARAEGRFYMRGLSVLLWLIFLVRILAGADGYSTAARSVLQFPAFALSGLLVLRLGALIRRAGHDVADDDTGHDFRRSLIRNLGLATVVLAILSVAAAAVGYASAANFILVPTIMSLALIGGLALLQGFATAIYALIVRKDEEAAREDLLPVLIGLLLAIGSIPVFALIWGARTTDLSEAWTKFTEGFTIGSTRVSPSDFLTFAVIFGAGYLATKLIQGTLRSTVLPKTRIDKGGQSAITSGLGYIGIFLSALFAITATGLDLSSLAIVAGALSVGIGFGLQNIVSNFVAGIIMLIERPVGIGDWIEVGQHSGVVKGISVRATRIETFDKTDVIVPNAEFVSGTVTNWTRYSNLGRVILPVKVPGGNDSRMVADLLQELAEAHPAVSGRHKPNVFLVSIEDGLRFEIRAIIKDVYMIAQVRSDLAHSVLERLAGAGLVHPIPQREIFMHQVAPSASEEKPARAPRVRKPRKPAAAT